MTSKERYEKYAQEITEKVIAQMEKGIIPWDKPFHMVDGKHNSYNSGNSYSLLNQYLLDLYLDENDKRDYIEYATFNAVKKAGGKVNKGAKAKVIYEMFITVKAKTDKEGNAVLDEDGKPVYFPFYNARKELVFDIEKDTNLQLKGKKERPENEIIPDAENVINNYITASGIKFEHLNNGKAYYSPANDLVNVPEIKAFKNSNFYYSVAFHELTHSTGHASRLNRIKDVAAFGSENYSKEELVAEIGAFTLTSTCGITTDKTEKDSIAYLQSWIGALKNDTTLFVKAIQQATRAVKYILDCTAPDEPDKKGSEGKAENTEPAAEIKYFMHINRRNSKNKMNKPFFRQCTNKTFIQDWGDLRIASYFGKKAGVYTKSINVYVAKEFKGSKWDITDETTGLKITDSFITKKEAIAFLTSDKMNKWLEFYFTELENGNSLLLQAIQSMQDFKNSDDKYIKVVE